MFRIVDRQPDQAHESRALAIQPRTLEVLAGLGLADRWSSAATRLSGCCFTPPAAPRVRPCSTSASPTPPYPFLLFLSQATTESHPQRPPHAGARRRPCVELVGLAEHSDHVACTVATATAAPSTVEARYVVGCDGAHSAVRRRPASRSPAPRTRRPSCWPTSTPTASSRRRPRLPRRRGMLFFFPLGKPGALATARHAPPTDPPTGRRDRGPRRAPGPRRRLHRRAVQLHDPVWIDVLPPPPPPATAYRQGRVFVAGDAAHIHSPAGAQGMNTGIQDAVEPRLEAGPPPRLANPACWTPTRPNGTRGRLRAAFHRPGLHIATSTNPRDPPARTRLAPVLVPLVPGSARRAPVPDGVQLASAIGTSPLSTTARAPRFGPVPATGSPTRPSSTTAARRPPAPCLAGPAVPPAARRATGPGPMTLSMTCRAISGLVVVHRIARQPQRGALHDTASKAHERLGVVGSRSHRAPPRPPGRPPRLPRRRHRPCGPRSVPHPLGSFAPVDPIGGRLPGWVAGRHNSPDRGTDAGPARPARRHRDPDQVRRRDGGEP